MGQGRHGGGVLPFPGKNVSKLYKNVFNAFLLDVWDFGKEVAYVTDPNKNLGHNL